MEYEKNHNVEVGQLSNSCAIKISMNEISLLIKDLLDSSDKSIKRKTLNRYRLIGEEFYQESCQLNEKIKLFEANIRRRFFCVTPLDEDQLNNWHLYLDFVEKQENLDWAMKLYERCLIPCANYPEFWMRYVDYLESKRGRELSISALERATNLFLKSVPEIHLFSARLKEHIGDVNGAQASLRQCHAKTDSCFLEKVATQAGMERRLGNLAEASALYEEAIRTAIAKQKTHILPKLYFHYARLIFMTTGSADAARDVLINATQKVPHSRFLFEELIKFAMTHEGSDQINIIDSIVEGVICPGSAEYDGMNVKDQESISSLFIEFVNLCGTVNNIRKAWNRHAKLFPRCLRSGATYESSTSGSSSIKMARNQKENCNLAVHDQPSLKQLLSQPMQLEIQRGAVEFSVDGDIHASQVMEKKSPQEDYNSKDKETAVTLSTEVVLSNKNSLQNDEQANDLSREYREDKQVLIDVSANLANQYKGNALNSQDSDHDFSSQFRVEKPGPMYVCPKFINKPEGHAISICESSIELCKPSGTTEPVQVSGGPSAAIDINSELDHEFKQQKQTISVDNTSLSSNEKQYEELIPMSCDGYETNRRVSAPVECTSQSIAVANYNSFTCPNSHETAEPPHFHDASERDGSVSQQDARPNIHLDPKELSRTGEESINMDCVVPVPANARSRFHEQEKEQEHQAQQSVTQHHHPANELDSKMLVNQCNTELNSTTENNSQAQGAITNDVLSASMMTHLSTVSTTQSPVFSSPLTSYPQNSMPQSTLVTIQHPGLAYQSQTTNQWMQYYYHQQHIMQQQYQQQLHMQQSFLQLQHQYMNQQQHQLQPHQHAQLVPQQYYVHDQHHPTQQQIISFQPFNQQIQQHHEQNHQITDHRQLQQGQQNPQLQELGYHINQLGFQQNAAAQGQPANFSHYQQYEQGYLHQQQSQEDHLHVQEHLHQHSDQKQQNEQLQKHHQVISKQNTCPNYQDPRPDYDGAAEYSK